MTWSEAASQGYLTYCDCIREARREGGQGDGVSLFYKNNRKWEKWRREGFRFGFKLEVFKPHCHDSGEGRKKIFMSEESKKSDGGFHRGANSQSGGGGCELTQWAVLATDKGIRREEKIRRNRSPGPECSTGVNYSGAYGGKGYGSLDIGQGHQQKSKEGGKVEKKKEREVLLLGAGIKGELRVGASGGKHHRDEKKVRTGFWVKGGRWRNPPCELRGRAIETLTLEGGGTRRTRLARKGGWKLSLGNGGRSRPGKQDLPRG